MEREKAAAKTKTLHWWLHWIGSPVAIFAILGSGLLYIAQAEVKPVIAKVNGEVKRLDAMDGQLQKQVTEVKMNLRERLKQINADLKAFKAQMHADFKTVATKDDLKNLKDKLLTPQQIRSIMREVLEEQRTR